MDIIYIPESGDPERWTSVEGRPAGGCLWFDVEREHAGDWVQRLAQISGVTLHEGHVKDSLNPRHPSFYDGTHEYEMIILRGLAPDSDEGQFASRPTAFFLLENILVTVRPADGRSVPAVKQRLLNRQGRIPRRSQGLMHQIMSTMVDRFLAMREPLTEQMERWRHELLDPHHPYSDWMALLGYQSQLRTLSLLCEGQEDAITQWREETDVEMDEHLAVRFNDLMEHIGRVTRFALEQQKDVEALVQLHFSAVAHRTNDIVRVLTVVSAIFLPLTLVAGIFGMNFQHMPELSYRYGYFVALGGMAGLAIGLLVLFRIKRWI
jgi:magnesium/cobalt transport protein CorA